MAKKPALDPAFVKRQLRGPNPLNHRRLVAVRSTTYARLEAAAAELTKTAGFFVWPLQVAALIVEREMGGKASGVEAREARPHEAIAKSPGGAAAKKA